MNTDTVHIRKAERADAADIVELYYLLLGDHSDIKGTEEMLESLKTDESNLVLVAETEKKIVGTLQACLIKSLAFNCRRFAVFDYFIVEPTYRRRGIGTKLFEFAEAYCKDKNVSCILFVSGKERKEGHLFYQKMGYDTSVKGFRKDLC